MSAEATFERLDPEQRAAVQAPDGAVLVLAGAGSGKTGTLTARVWWLISHHDPPVSARTRPVPKKDNGLLVSA